MRRFFLTVALVAGFTVAFAGPASANGSESGYKGPCSATFIPAVKGVGRGEAVTQGPGQTTSQQVFHGYYANYTTKYDSGNTPAGHTGSSASLAGR